MKRLIVCMFAGVLAACFALAGCAGGSGSPSAAGDSSAADSSASVEASAAESSTAEASDSAESSSAAEEPPSEPAAITGGWAVPEGDVTDDLTDEEEQVFMSAAGAQAGMDFQPIAVLATQVVAGQNIAYLCKGTPTTQDPVTEWDVVVVYKDLQGDASISSVTPIDLADVKATEDTALGEAVGAWEVKEATSGTAMTAEAAQAFSKAAEEWDGVEINPLALLGTQVVAGTNYLVLGTGHAVVQDPATSLYVATVYEDLEGNCEFTDVSQLDLLAYLG